jgi:hypothetical protein
MLFAYLAQLALVAQEFNELNLSLKFLSNPYCYSTHISKYLPIGIYLSPCGPVEGNWKFTTS